MIVFGEHGPGQYAQGEITLSLVRCPKKRGAEVEADGGLLVVSHSETGHHHAIRGAVARMERGEDPFTCYLYVDGAHADLVNLRDVNPHETVRLPKPKDGWCYRVFHQREETPAGWRKVQD